MSNRSTAVRNGSMAAALVMGLALAAGSASAGETAFGHEASACIAWDIQLRYMLEQRQLQATLSAADGEVILDEVKHASRLCESGRFRSALNRFAALYDLLSGEGDERDEQG